MTQDQERRLDAAALALCRMRGKDPMAQVDQCIKRTWRAHYLLELHDQMQVHIALRDAGLIKEV